MALRETDIHTGLHTAGFLVAYGARALSRTIEQGSPVSLLTIGLVSITDTDSEIPARILRIVGEQIRIKTGATSVIAGIGDNEVAVLLPGKRLDQAQAVADSIRESIEETVESLSDGAMMGVSIGVASSADGLVDFSDLMKASQDALDRSRETE